MAWQSAAKLQKIFAFSLAFSLFRSDVSGENELRWEVEKPDP
jgi:hypothetical protein